METRGVKVISAQDVVFMKNFEHRVKKNYI